MRQKLAWLGKRHCWDLNPDLLFTRQALWPTKPQHHFSWQNSCTDTIWQDQLAVIMINNIRRERKSTLDWGKGTAGIWTQDLLFTRQALWPTKPQHLFWMGKVTGNTIWQDKLVEMKLTKSELRQKLRLTGEKALLGFEPRISCLLNRHFDQLSHSTTFCGKTDVQTLYDRTNKQKLWLTKSQGKQKPRFTGEKALLGFEPRISCLLDRHFDQLSHSTTFVAKLMYRHYMTGQTSRNYD